METALPYARKRLRLGKKNGLNRLFVNNCGMSLTTFVDIVRKQQQ